MRLCHLLCTLLPLLPTQYVEANDEAETWDCALGAMYILLSLEGHPCDPAELRRILPARPEAISVQDLIEASKKMRLPLSCVRLSKQDCTRFGTFIAFAEHEGKPYGHFLVARPIGQTYLQLINPPRVQLVPIERMFPDTNSTVVALIRQRSDPRLTAAWALLSAGLLLLLGILLPKLRRRLWGNHSTPDASIPSVPA